MSGRVALVTGAARGQGRAHATRLSAEGADVILVDIAGQLPAGVPYESSSPADLAETARLVTANGRRAITAVVDIRDLEALCAAVDNGVAQLGRLDVIVANAGICCPAAWDQISGQDFRDTVDTNVVGTWNTVMAGAHHIIDGANGGSVILIGSAAAVKVQAFMVHYTASKHAITGLARAFAVELGAHNIRVNSLHPGSVASPMVTTGGMINALKLARESNPRLGNLHTPLLPQEIVMPDDVADAVAWLASDESRFVTASEILVDLGVSHS
jgi:SDR family mycofactocin-dependent oxidoreductase